jgi:hypothetical protein
MSEPPLEVRCQWCGYFFCSFYCVRRILVYRETQQYQYEHQETSWAPGPSRIQNPIEFREAEILQPKQNPLESSLTISEDGYTRLDPGHVWIEASNNTGGGGQV